MKKKIIVGLAALGGIIAIVGISYLSSLICCEPPPIPPEIPQEGASILSEEDVKSILREIEIINQPPANKQIDPDSYPKIVGIYEKNNWPLKLVYFCADICPDLGYVTLIFADVTSSGECRKIGGVYQKIDDPTFSIRSCKPNIKLEN